MQANQESVSAVSTHSDNELNISRNLIEFYVMQEVDQHFHHLPEATRDFVSKSDILAYALNRLPAMYATTRRGYLRQTSEIKILFADKISQVVQQGIAAVQSDPFRFSKPLDKRTDVGAERALEQLRSVLGDRSITWENVAEVVHNRLQQQESSHAIWAPTVGAQAKFDWTPIALRDMASMNNSGQAQ